MLKKIEVHTNLLDICLAYQTLEISSNQKTINKQANKLVSDQIYTKKKKKELFVTVIHSCATKKRIWAITGLIINGTY